MSRFLAQNTLNSEQNRLILAKCPELGSASTTLNYDRFGYIVRIANILPTVNRSIKEVGNADLMPT